MQPVVGSTQPLPDPPSYEPDSPGPLPAGGAAIASLVFAITGLVGPLPLLGSLIALGFVRRARREAYYGVAGGWEVARGARMIAWTTIILLVVAAAVIAAVIVWNVRHGHHYDFHLGG